MPALQRRPRAAEPEPQAAPLPAREGGRERADEPASGLIQRLLSDLPSGMVLLDRRAGVHARSGRAQALPLLLHAVHCTGEVVDSIGPHLRVTPGRDAAAADEAGAAALLLARENGEWLCIGGGPGDLSPFAPHPRPQAVPLDGERTEVLFRCLARHFPSGWLYAFDPHLRTLLGVGNVLALVGFSRGRVEGVAAMRWVASAHGRCALQSRVPPRESHPGRLALHALPEGGAAMSFRA